MDSAEASFEYNVSNKRPSTTSTLSLHMNHNNNNSTNNNVDVGTPPKKIKMEKFDLTYMGSPREMRRLRADLLIARNTILDLEGRIQHMHNIRKETSVMFENETKALKRQQEHDRKTIAELEEQLQIVRKREADLRDELARVKNDYNMLKIRKDEEIEELDKSVNELKEESRIYEGEESSLVSNLNRKINELHMLLEAAEDDAEGKKKLVEQLEQELRKKNAVERAAEIKEQALQAAKLKIKELQYAESNFMEYQEQAKTQANKLARYHDLERENERLNDENTRLKDEVKNKLILEEEVYNLKLKLSTFKEHEKKYNELLIQKTQNEMHLDEWKAVARGICEITGSDSSLPQLLRSTVERLQQQELSLTSSKFELESKLNQTTHETRVAKSELEKTQKLLETYKKASEQKQSLIHRMQKKLLLISRERDSYRLQLDSYEKDLTMNVSSIQSGHNNQIQAQKERIANLEEMIENYKELLAKLENELANVQPDLIPEHGVEHVTRLKDELNQLQLENDRLRVRLDQAEIQLEEFAIGMDTVNDGQVIHQKNNPLQECIQQREQYIDNLKQEIERLKRKIKQLENGFETSKLNESVNTKEVQQLKEQLKNSETNTQKLKEYIKSSLQDFRSVIYMLFGYRVDRDQNGTLYKLTSMYAERPEDQLCFQFNNEGALNLLENEFSSSLEDMVTLHLRRQKSIPVFLSAITMDLFTNNTMTKTEIEEID